MARELWWFGIFGIIHGFGEWWIMIIAVKVALGKSVIVMDKYIGVLLLSLSFVVLFYFGVRVIVSKFPRFTWLEYLARVVIGIWVLVMVMIANEQHSSWITEVGIWSRHLLCFPGALLASGGFFAHKQDFSRLKVQHSKFLFFGVAVAFLFYGIVSGMVNPNPSFSRFSWLQEAHGGTVPGMLFPILRALAGVFMAYFTIRIVGIFYQDNVKRLEAVEREQALISERERISRELHDGIIQSIYATGLMVEEAAHLVERLPEKAKETLQLVIDALNKSILDIRFFIQDLKISQNYKGDFFQNLEFQLQKFTYLAQIHGEFSSSGQLPSDLFMPEARNHLHYIVQEVLINVVKHAKASKIDMQAEVAEDTLYLAIKDNGKGMRVTLVDNAALSGEGMNNVRLRTAILNGRCGWEFSGDAGTKFTLTVPLR